MADPLEFLPLALAAADGSIDGIPCRRLVAAGLSVLQRTAPLVRALHSRRTAVLLPASPQLLVALTASSGRGALLLDPYATAEVLARQLADADAGAAFTVADLAERLPPSLPRVLLDEAPLRASWQEGDATRAIDLTSHVGLHLEGDAETEGAEEEAVLVAVRGADGSQQLEAATHRSLLRAARALARAVRLSGRDHTLALASPSSHDGLVAGFLAPLLAGGRVSTAGRTPARARIALLEEAGVSMLVATRAEYTALAEGLARRATPLDAPVLQRCVVCADLRDQAAPGPTDGSLPDRWLTLTGQRLVAVSSPSALGPGRP